MRNARNTLIRSLIAWTLVGGLVQSGLGSQEDRALSQNEDPNDPMFRARFDEAARRDRPANLLFECRIFIAHVYSDSSGDLILRDRQPLTGRDPTRIYADEGDAFKIRIAASVVVQLREVRVSKTLCRTFEIRSSEPRERLNLRTG